MKCSSSLEAIRCCRSNDARAKVTRAHAAFLPHSHTKRQIPEYKRFISNKVDISVSFYSQNWFSLAAKAGWQGHTRQTLRGMVAQGLGTHSHSRCWWECKLSHTHWHTRQHDADKIKGQLTLWGNWIFIKYLWMSSSEWREASMPCKNWWEDRGKRRKQKAHG